MIIASFDIITKLEEKFKKYHGLLYMREVGIKAPQWEIANIFNNFGSTCLNFSDFSWFGQVKNIWRIGIYRWLFV